MIKTAAFVIIIALRLIYQPTKSQQRNAPFASPKPVSTTAQTNIPATFIGISGIKISNWIIRKWIMGEGRDAWCIKAAGSALIKYNPSI
jgi:hypothetical protein